MKFNFSPFTVEYEKPKYPVLNFKDECILAAKKASEKNTKNLPIIIMMSGGVDSEIVAKSFLEANIPFKVIIGRYLIRLASETITFNQYDWEYAAKFCRDNKIEQHFCDIDLFADAEVISYIAKENFSFSPQYACKMFIMNWCKKHNYFYVTGDGEITIVLKNEKYYSEEEQREYVPEIFRQKHDIDGVSQFFKQDGRLIASFLQLPTVQKLILNRVPNLLPFKNECYADAFTFEYRKKQTGFENITFWDNILRESLKKIHKDYDNKYYVSIENFLES